jgi:UDP-N-acetylglucosamine 2-epimerase
MREMAKYPQEFEQLLVHTGQHYDDNMSQVFFEYLELPQPDIYLGVGSGSHAQQTARIMLAFEPVQEEINEYTSSCNEKGRGSTSATLEGRNRYR